MAASTPLVLDHVLNSNHDALSHSAVFSSGSDGILFCVHCAAERYDSAPDFRQLALLDGIRVVLTAHGPRSLGNDGIEACLPMLLRGIDSSNSGIVQAATDIMLAVQEEFHDPVGVLASLISNTVSLGLPRASGHLYLVGQLLTNTSRDRTLATTLGNACFTPLREDLHAGAQQQQRHATVGMNENGGGLALGAVGHGGGGGADWEQQLRGFGSFLAAHAVSASCPDDVKSDVLYVAMELLDCCVTACAGAGSVAVQGLASMPPPPESDPFVSAMLAIPRLLARRSSCDEPLQLHSIAYLATAVRYSRQRAEMGVPGWSSRHVGVPDVLIALFDGAQVIAPQETVGGGGGGSGSSGVGKGNSSQPPSNSGLCSTLKTLLMSPSYRVRSATARLITSLCADDRNRYPEGTMEAHGNDATAGGFAKGTGHFFRETLLEAGATDFLFEAIKSEREGTPKRYLEAAEALALSPVEFFHADNFSLKFAAPVLLGAARGGNGGGGGADGSPFPRDESCNQAGPSAGGDDDEVAVFSLSSRLLLQALVTVPSSGGVVEDLLATAAISAQPDTTNTTRAIGLAADVLSLVASGDILLSKDRGSFLDAVGVLLEHLEADLARAALSDFEQEQPQQIQARNNPTPTERPASLPIRSADQPRVREHELYDGGGGGGGDLILQCARIYESIFYTSEEWISSRGTALGRPSFEEGVALADLVFGAYERTLPYQWEVINSSESRNLAHDVAFLSSMGAAVDAASAVLSCKKRRREEAAGSGSSSGSENGTLRPVQVLDVQPSFIHAKELAREANAMCSGADDGSGDGGGGGGSAQEGLLRTGEVDSTPASCLETILRTAVEGDIVSWMLDLYARCRRVTSDAAVTPRSPLQMSDGDDETCGETTRKLLAEVLQSVLYAQGWVNGLCAHGDHCPSHAHERDGVGGDSTFLTTLRSLLRSWATSGARDDAEILLPLDQYAMSRLGTRADKGDMCKLAALLVSLSPSFLGVLHPHAGCRVDSAVTLLRYVKTVPEAVFCLNMFSHAVLAAAGGGDQTSGDCGQTRLPGLSDSISTAVSDVLARFPAGELALSSIPLSATALSFALLAGCDGFVADWLVAAPLARIKIALTKFGVFGDWQQQQQQHFTGDIADSSEQQGEQQTSNSAAIGTLDREALIGVVRAALSRWGAEVEIGAQQHSQSDAVIHRLTCILLMAPDTFLSLALDFDFQRQEDPGGERRGRQELAAFGTIIPDTLEGLSARFSAMAVVSRSRDRASDSFRNSSKLACASQVSQLATAFLRARCRQGYYSSASSDASSATAASPSSSTHGSLEISLACACGGLLQWMLDPRRGRSPNTFGAGGGEDSVHRALLSVLNLLCALLVLKKSRQGLSAALQESRAALSGVLSPGARAVERLMGWLDDAPDVLAAFLQACAVWNATESASNGSDDCPGGTPLTIPFQVLGEVLSSGGHGPYLTAGGGGVASTNDAVRSNQKAPSRAVRVNLLRVLAVRCVETSARARSFSGREVVALQLTLQGFACGSSAALACAAHEAIEALWESYAGLLQSVDLVGQSWNPFMVECSLENAVRSLSSRCDQESEADYLILLALGEEPEEFRVDAPVLVSAIGRLLCGSAGKSCPRLRSSEVLRGCSIELLSVTAVVSVYQCAALLATKLRTMLLEEIEHPRKRQRQNGATGLGDQRSNNGSGSSSEGRHHDEGIGGNGATFHLSDALMQLARVLLCIEPLPPEQGSAVRRDARTKLAEALALLHSSLVGFGEGRNRRLEGNGEPPEQVFRPLSSGGYYDGSGSHGASFNVYEGVLFVKHDNWRWLSCTPYAISFLELANEVERLVEQLSAESGAGFRTGGDGLGVQDQASNEMLVDAV